VVATNSFQQQYDWFYKITAKAKLKLSS